MAKFCTKCGKPLEEGEICSCLGQQQAQAINQNQNQVVNQQQAGPNKVTSYLNRLWKVTLQIIKTPADMLKEYVKASDIELAFGYIGVQAIAIALFLLTLFSQVNSQLKSLFGGLGYFGGLLGVDAIKFPLGKIFILTIIFSVVLSFAFAAVLFFVTKVIFKGETDFKKMICVAGAKSLAAVPFTVVAFICIFISISIAIFILCLGTILGYFYVASALKGASEIDENKSVYTLFISFALMVIVLGIVYKIALPMFMPSGLDSIGNTMKYFN